MAASKAASSPLSSRGSASSSGDSCTYSESYCCEGEFDEYDDLCSDLRLPYCEDRPKGYKYPQQYLRRQYFYGEGSPVSSPPRSSYGSSLEERAEPSLVPSPQEPDYRKQSIFVHSSPSQFPDIRKASKSVFGSIFVRTTVSNKHGSSGWRKAADSQFNMVPTYMDTIDSKSDSTDSDRKFTFKDSVFRAFEKRGIAKDISSTSSSQWDVYPITQSALFSFQQQDRIHQTRHLYKIEERMTSSQMQYLRFSYGWPSGSTWSGHWDGLGMAGTGTFTMPHEVCYIGKMKDGMCDDTDAILIYPNGFRALHCHYVEGRLQSYKFQFPDMLDHERENWGYCQYPDRRFWSEVQNGLKPAQIAQKTQKDPPRKIPKDCYDTNDGFYNPKTKMLLSPEGELLRVPTCEEEEWIKAKCRKGFHEFTGFRPKLFENWYNDDKELIQRITDMQKSYLKGIITYDELYQFYADNDLLPTCSPFKKSKTPSQMEMEKIMENCPTPKKLVHRLEKRYEGHRIPRPNDALKAHRITLMQKRMMKRKSCSPFEQVRKEGVNMEKLSWKMKSGENSKTQTVSIANMSLEEKDSRAILRHVQPAEKVLKEETYRTSPPTSLDEISASQQSSSSPSSPSSSSSSSSSTTQSRLLKKRMTDLIMTIVDGIVWNERERHRDRLVRLQSVQNLPFGPRNGKEECLQVLQHLYQSIPDTEEYCDSTPQHACNLKNLAHDRYKTVKYWGKRIFTLGFD